LNSAALFAINLGILGTELGTECSPNKPPGLEGGDRFRFGIKNVSSEDVGLDDVSIGSVSLLPPASEFVFSFNSDSASESAPCNGEEEEDAGLSGSDSISTWFDKASDEEMVGVDAAEAWFLPLYDLAFFE
jgi:hypothetical protein